MDLVTLVYGATARFPDSEAWGLTGQMRRAAVSIPCNIAEVKGRITDGEKRQVLGHARGSTFELATLIDVAQRLGYLDRSESGQLQESVDRIGKSLSALIRTVRRRPTSNVQRLTSNV